MHLRWVRYIISAVSDSLWCIDLSSNLPQLGFGYAIRAWILLCYPGLDWVKFSLVPSKFMLNSAMVLRFILDIPTFSRFFFDIPTFFALYLRCHNIFAWYPRYLDISRQMWMQKLMKSKDEIAEIPKLTKRTKCENLDLDNRIIAEKSMRICTKAEI